MLWTIILVVLYNIPRDDHRILIGFEGPLARSLSEVGSLFSVNSVAIAFLNYNSNDGEVSMKKSCVVLVLVLVSMFAVAPAGSWAEETAFKLKPGETMREVLAEFSGKVLALRLESGEELEGTVTMVGNSLVQISKLTGKEFYDAVVSIDKISAVRMRTRSR